MQDCSDLDYAMRQHLTGIIKQDKQNKEELGDATNHMRAANRDRDREKERGRKTEEIEHKCLFTFQAQFSYFFIFLFQYLYFSLNKFHDVFIRSICYSLIQSVPLAVRHPPLRKLPGDVHLLQSTQERQELIKFLDLFDLR